MLYLRSGLPVSLVLDLGERNATHTVLWMASHRGGSDFGFRETSVLSGTGRQLVHRDLPGEEVG
jgi:hypothetical protein